MDKIDFNGEFYHDDRMFVLYLCKGTNEIRSDCIVTTIYHENPPTDALWCLVTYKNSERYIPTRVDTFDSEKEAMKYMRRVEPMTPLISFGGKPLNPALNYEDYLKWKIKNGYKDYNYKAMFNLTDGEDPTEVIYRSKNI